MSGDSWLTFHFNSEILKSQEDILSDDGLYAWVTRQ